MASALDYAHRRGVVHRDVKPQNMLLDESRNIFLTDFGIAKALSDSNNSNILTQTGAIIGTPAYMAPEQWRSQPLDGRADQYSLGAVCYEMLTGHTPFVADTPHGMMYFHLQEAPPDIHTQQKDLPPALATVLNRALAKERESRFESTEAFATAIKGVADGKVAAPPATAEKPKKKSVLPLTLVGGVILLSGVGLVLSLASRPQQAGMDLTATSANTSVANTTQPTATNAIVVANTSAPTAINTLRPTNTVPPTATNTILPTATDTIRPTNTVPPTATNTTRPTNTVPPTATDTIRPTNTVPPTATPTNAVTPTAANTATPTATYTQTLVPTITPTIDGVPAPRSFAFGQVLLRTQVLTAVDGLRYPQDKWVISEEDNQPVMCVTTTDWIDGVEFGEADWGNYSIEAEVRIDGLDKNTEFSGLLLLNARVNYKFGLYEAECQCQLHPSHQVQLLNQHILRIGEITSPRHNNQNLV
jgi:Protein kinase domain